jgi:lipopolysaccharide export system permease protein
LNTLQKYIARRVAVISMASFFSILGVVWVTQALNRIDFATGSGQSIISFLSFFAMLTPEFATIVLPFAVVIGTVQVFNTMNSDSELAVMSASGASRRMIAVPVLFVACIASAWIFISGHLVEPRANRAGRDILLSARTDLLTSLLREGTFTKIEPNLTIYIDKRLPDNQMSGIMVSDTRDPKLSLIYYAQSGAVGTVGGNDVLVMRNGQIQRKRAEDDSLSIIRFNSYAIGLSQFASAAHGFNYYPDERETSALLNPDPNDKTYKNFPGWIRGEFHRRMADWMYPILFAMVGLVIAGQTQSHRQAQFNTYFLALGGALIYRWAAYAVYAANRTDGRLWWLFYAVPIAGILLNAAFYRFGIVVTIPDRVLLFAGEVASFFKRLRVRAARARAA